MIRFLLLYVLVINVVTFALYGIDKFKAKRGLWRIPEATLLWLAVAGGTVGALAGMYVWHHKTKHYKFLLGVPAILLVQVIIYIWVHGWLLEF